MDNFCVNISFSLFYIECLILKIYHEKSSNMKKLSTKLPLRTALDS